jgi:hypothetical protein
MRLSSFLVFPAVLTAATIPLHFEPGERPNTFLAVAGARTITLSATEVVMGESRLRLAKADPRARVTRGAPLAGRSHYLVGAIRWTPR